MFRIRIVSALAVALAIGAVEAAAFETDQFMAWEVELADSTDRVNEYLNESIEHVLFRINRHRPEEVACEEIASRVYRYLYRHFLSARIRRFLESDEEVNRFPADDVRNGEYLNRSIYQRPAWPFFMPMSRTVRINGVNLGTDKFDHMLSFGRRYHVRYLRARERGLGEDEAVRKVVIWGLWREKLLVGGIADGVFSYADLEANYQGMRMSRAFCEGERQTLTLEAAGWRLANPIDLRDYVTPAFDEAYNTNHYPRYRWHKVQAVLHSEVCPRYRSPAVQALLSGYSARERPNASQMIIGEYQAGRGTHLQEEQSLDRICPPLQAASEPPSELSR